MIHLNTYVMGLQPLEIFLQTSDYDDQSRPPHCKLEFLMPLTASNDPSKHKTFVKRWSKCYTNVLCSLGYANIYNLSVAVITQF